MNISIWLRKGTITNTTTPGQSGPESYGNEGSILHSLKQQDRSLTIRLLSVISRTLTSGSLTPQQRRSRRILQSQPTRLSCRWCCSCGEVGKHTNTHTQIHTHTHIYIPSSISLSWWQFFGTFLSYHPSLFSRFLGCILRLHGADICKSLLNIFLTSM